MCRKARHPATETIKTVLACFSSEVLKKTVARQKPSLRFATLRRSGRSSTTEARENEGQTSGSGDPRRKARCVLLDTPQKTSGALSHPGSCAGKRDSMQLGLPRGTERAFPPAGTGRGDVGGDAGRDVGGDAEETYEKQIRWRSLPGSDLHLIRFPASLCGVGFKFQLRCRLHTSRTS